MPRHNDGMDNISEQDAITRIWELVESIATCMVVTWDGKEQHSRPMRARLDDRHVEIFFLTDVSGRKDDEITRYPTINLSFADPGSNKYVSLSGEASVTNDRAKIADLWSEFDKAWWDSKEDPDIRL